MSALGKGMQRSLESGVYVCVHVHMNAFLLFLPLIALLHRIHVCAGVSGRGRHEVMIPLTSAAAHGSGQSQQIMEHSPGIPGHGMLWVA